MMRKLMIGAGILGLAACDEIPRTTAEGCRIGYGPIMKAGQHACQAVHREQAALAAGGTVTRCYNTSGGMSCVTY